MILPLIVIILTSIIVFVIVTKKPIEFYQNTVTEQEGWIETIRKNFEEENKLIKELTPFYNLIVKNEAGKKSNKPEEYTKYEPEVRESIANNQKGVIQLFKVNRVLEVIAALNDLPTESQLYLSYLFLPSNINEYKITTQYLYDTGSKYYETLSTLGGADKSKKYDVSGATATSLGISKNPEPDSEPMPTFKSAPMTDESFADCCNKPTLADITTSDGGDLKRQIDKIKKSPLKPNDIETLLNKSNERIKSLNAMTDLKPLIEKTRAVFQKLNSLTNSINSNGPGAADKGIAKLVEGKPLDKALEGFSNSHSEWQKYSFLIRPRA